MSTSEATRGCFLAFVLVGAVLALGGCESADDPTVTGLASRDYEETFDVDVTVDEVYVLVGTTEYEGQDSPASVSLDPEPVSGARLRFRIRVVGLTVGTTPRAISGYRWNGDTLRVWCGYEPSGIWGKTPEPSPSDPWQPPYLIPREVFIGSPATVDVQFVGHWFE